MFSFICVLFFLLNQMTIPPIDVAIIFNHIIPLATSCGIKIATPRITNAHREIKFKFVLINPTIPLVIIKTPTNDLQNNTSIAIREPSKRSSGVTTKRKGI